jgi:Na+-translocating ferredoxin:NAD+ oxidoreductase RnfE subunit
MAKLTLSVNPSVVARAKRYAKQRGVSVSEMVESYLDAVSAPPEPASAPPVLRSVRGILRKGSLQDYRRHLSRKHR